MTLPPLPLGLAFLLASTAIAGLLRDSALALAFAVVGIFLVVWAYAGDRLKAVGATRIELFEATKERLAAKIDPDLSGALRTNRGTGQAAAAIRAAKTPEELADVIVSILDRPERKFTTDDLLDAERELQARGYHGRRDRRGRVG